MACFPQTVFAVAIERDVIVLDAAADRYLALPGAVTAQDAEPADVQPYGSLLPEAAAALMEAGLLVANSGAPDFVALSKPVQMHAGHHAPERRVRMVEFARFTFSVAITGWKLRRGVGCGTFGRQRRTDVRGVSDDLVDALTMLRETRLIVPSPRRCLPASLIAARFLRQRGHDVEIVFGVRSHPFAAHCWIEAGGVVLDDDLDRVRAFTPIAVGTL